MILNYRNSVWGKCSQKDKNKNRNKNRQKEDKKRNKKQGLWSWTKMHPQNYQGTVKMVFKILLNLLKESGILSILRKVRKCILRARKILEAHCQLTINQIHQFKPDQEHGTLTLQYKWEKQMKTIFLITKINLTLNQ